MPVLVSYIQRTVGDGWSFIILRIRGGIPCFEEVMPIRGGHQPESSSLAHGHDSWNGGHRPDDWSIYRTALPDDRSCRRVERPQAPRATPPVDRRLAATNVEIGAIPGTGRNAAITELWCRPALSDGHGPDGTSADTGLIKGIIVSILVGHAQQTMDAASDGGGEQRWRGAKIAIAYLLSWWNLPGIHKCQVGGVELDDGNGIGLWL